MPYSSSLPLSLLLQISAIAIVIGIIFFIIAMSMEYNFMEAAVFVIGIIVANVPEVCDIGE